jgi:hypothetical protein
MMGGGKGYGNNRYCSGPSTCSCDIHQGRSDGKVLHMSDYLYRRRHSDHLFATFMVVFVAACVFVYTLLFWGLNG